MKYKYSVITSVRNGLGFFIRSFKSVISADFSGPVEYFVIDDASDGILRKFLERAKSDIENPLIDFKMIRNIEKLGVIKSRNKALDLATGEYIVQVDSDVILHKDWESGVMKYLEIPDTVAAGPSGSYIWPDWSNFNYAGEKALAGDYVDMLMGFFWVWKNLQPGEWKYDEEFGEFWHEEAELQFRMKRETGRRLIKCDQVADHLCQPSEWKASKDIWRQHDKNLAAVVNRYKPLVEEGEIRLENIPSRADEKSPHILSSHVEFGTQEIKFSG